MAYLLIPHQVKNYSAWKDSFIEDRLTRRKTGYPFLRALVAVQLLLPQSHGDQQDNHQAGNDCRRDREQRTRHRRIPASVAGTGDVSSQ